MICTPAFTILGAVSGFGWNYFSQKIKEEKVIEKSQDADSARAIHNVYNIQGDFVKGVKNERNFDKKSKNKEIGDNENDGFNSNNDDTPILDIANTTISPNPYFTYNGNEMDFVVSLYAVGNSIGYVIEKSLILVEVDANGVPIDKKVFHATDLTGDDLIYKEKPFRFSQRMGNLPPTLVDMLFVVVDIKYTNQKKTIVRTIRKMYEIKNAYNHIKIPQATKEQYSKIDKYLDEK